MGYALASIYHIIGLLAGFVCFTFLVDIRRQMVGQGDRVRDWPLRYLRGWIKWAQDIPSSLKIALGILPTTPEPIHPYGVGFNLQVGVAQTAGAWFGMALYWAEKNVGWMNDFQSGDYWSIVPPFVFCAFYARGYLMHLKTIWQGNPHRWKLFLLASLIYIPAATIIRAMD